MVEPDHEVVIVGAGLSGIGAAVRLRAEGIDDFTILEAADDIGGTWRDNTYPGLAVDVSTLTYQYPFELNPDWSRVFAPGAEVKRYIDDVFDKHDLRPNLQLNTKVDELVFDEANHLWEVRLAERTIRARYVIYALGVLTQPKLPEIEGIEKFEGKTIHTARWDHDHDLAGKRVAVIGTGATAVQLIPEIATQTGSLHVFQRTPIWVFAKFDPEIPRAVRWAFRRVSHDADGIARSRDAGPPVGRAAVSLCAGGCAADRRRHRHWLRQPDRDSRFAVLARFPFKQAAG